MVKLSAYDKNTAIPNLHTWFAHDLDSFAIISAINDLCSKSNWNKDPARHIMLCNRMTTSEAERALRIGFSTGLRDSAIDVAIIYSINLESVRKSGLKLQVRLT